MAANSQGIATLLDAEKEASQIVAKAREYRGQRIKEARGEASKEIDALKVKKDKEFDDFEKQHSGSASSSQSDVDAATAAQLEHIQSSFDQNRSKVVDQLLERVVLVQAGLHKNLQVRK
ncbi:hypothetical protein JCM11641_002819 [Rhodosporidiobolus odoratus]